MKVQYNVGFFGAGKMAEGILGAVNAKSGVIMSDTNAARLSEMKRRHHVMFVSDSREVAMRAKLIFLAVRPQDVDALAEEVRPLLGIDQTIVSIVAGKTLAYLRKAFGPKVKLVRVMPNLAARSQAGMFAITAPKTTPAVTVAKVEKLLAEVGETMVLDERHFDAVTALSGSGPAYFAFMLRAMADAGAKLGLKKDVARKLATQTMYGTGKFLKESAMGLDEFIAGVCTKGGTTAAGMAKLDVAGFTTAVAETIEAAAARSKELAK